jgi:hypothetical protein
MVKSGRLVKQRDLLPRRPLTDGIDPMVAAKLTKPPRLGRIVTSRTAARGIVASLNKATTSARLLSTCA